MNIPQSIINSFMSRKPLCHHINNCRNLREKGNCQFAHDQCRFKQKCKDGPDCKFYHPQWENRDNLVPKSPIKKDMKSIPCKNGPNCPDKFSGKCKFNHDGIKAPREKALCKFGDKCNRGDQCRFLHEPSMKKQVSLKPKISEKMITEEDEHEKMGKSQFKYGVLQELDQRQCYSFLMNQCDDELQCQEQHILVTDKSVRRLFHTKIQNAYQLGSNRESIMKQYLPTFTMQFITIVSIKQQPIFALIKILEQKQTVGFYELDDQFHILKSVTNKQYSDQETITEFYHQTNSNQLYYRTQTNKLKRLNLIKGEVKEYPLPEQEIVGVIETKGQGTANILLIAFTNSIFTVKDNEYKQIVKQQSKKFTCIKKFLYSSEEILVVGDTAASVTIFNATFKSHYCELTPQLSTVTDISFAKIYNQPHILVSLVNFNQGSSSLYAINLLSFESFLVLSCKSGIFSKLIAVYDKVLVGVDEQGVMIYSSDNYGTPIGRIPILGRVHSLFGTEAHGLVMVGQNQMNKTITSVYKIRKPDGYQN